MSDVQEVRLLEGVDGLMYTYKSWGGHTKKVEATSVVFEPGHVVFYKNVWGKQVIVLAERNENVNELKEVQEDE